MFIPIKRIDIALAQYFESMKLGIASPFYKNLNYLTLKYKIKNLIKINENIFHKKKIIDGKGLRRVIKVLCKEYENS